MEFLLQLQQLRVGVRGSQASGQAVFWNEFSCNWKLHFLFESRGECEFEPGAALDTRHSSVVNKLLHSLGFIGRESRGRVQVLGEINAWQADALPQLVVWRNCLLQLPETPVLVIQSISSSPTITNSATRQLRNNFTHFALALALAPNLSPGNASLAHSAHLASFVSRSAHPIWSVK